MTVITQLDSNNNLYYTVENVENFNDFIKWLFDIEEDNVSVSFNGYLYRFRTIYEARQFALGFQAAWCILDDKELNKDKL